MHRDGSEIILDSREELDVLGVGIDETDQGFSKTASVLFLISESGSKPEFRVDPEHFDNVELALYGAIATEGLRGVALRVTGKKKLARRMIKAINLPFDGSLDGNLLRS